MLGRKKKDIRDVVSKQLITKNKKTLITCDVISSSHFDWMDGAWKDFHYMNGIYGMET